MTPDAWVPASVIAVPLLAAPVAAILSASRQAQTWVGLGALLLEALLVLWLIGLIAASGVVGIPVLSVDLLGMTFAFLLAVDGLSGAFILLTVVVALATALYHAEDTDEEGRRAHRMPLLLGAVGLLAGLAASGNLLTLYVWWQLVVLGGALTMATGLAERSLAAMSKYLVMAQAGVLLILFSLGLVYGAGPDTGITGWASHADPEAARVVALLLSVAALLALAAFPLHTWLVGVGQVMEASLVPLLLAVQSKVGFYLLARMAGDPSVMVLVPGWGLFVGGLGAITVLVAAVNSLARREIRPVLTFLAVAQGGFLLLGLSTGEPLGWAGSLYHLIVQGLAVSLIVFALTWLNRPHQAGVEEGTGQVVTAAAHPLAAAAFLVAALTLVGVPPWAGYAGFALTYQGLLSSGEPIRLLFAFAGVVGSLLLGAALVVLGGSLLLGGSGRTAEARAELNPFSRTAVGMLTATCLLVGVFPRLLLDSLVLGPAGLVASGSWFDLAVADSAGVALAEWWSPLLVAIAVSLPLAVAAGAYLARARWGAPADSVPEYDLAAAVRSLSTGDHLAPAKDVEPVAPLRWWNAWRSSTGESRADVYTLARGVVMPVASLAARLTRLTFRLLLR